MRELSEVRCTTEQGLGTGARSMGLGVWGGSPPGPDLVLTPPSGSGEAWAPSSSFSRFYSRTQGSGAICQHISSEVFTRCLLGSEYCSRC